MFTSICRVNVFSGKTSINLLFALGKTKARVIFSLSLHFIAFEELSGKGFSFRMNIYFLHSTYGIIAWNEGTWGLHKDAFNNCRRCWERYIWCT